jgi:GxxExxY protein
MKVHSVVDPGLLESAYEACLVHELRSRGLEVATQVPLPLVYEGQKLEVGYRIDLAVEHRVIVEVKSVEAIHPIHRAQPVFYMRFSGVRVGSGDQLHRPSPSRWHSTNGRRERLAEIALCSPVLLCAPCDARFFALPPYDTARLQKFSKKPKKILHLWKFPVISQLRTNFAEMPGKSQHPGSREKGFSGFLRPGETRW